MIPKKKNTDVYFRLKYRKKFNPDNGLMERITQNVLITMRITYKSMRIELSTGYHIDALRWDDKSQMVLGPNRDGLSADEINLGLMQLSRNVNEAAKLYDDSDLIPSQDEFKNCLQRIKDGTMGITKFSPVPSSTIRKSSSPKKKREVADSSGSKPSTKRAESIINNNYESTNNLSFWDITYEFERQCGRQNNWTEATYEKFRAMRAHLKSLREYKRSLGLKTFDINFDYFDEDGLLDYIEFLRDVKNMMNGSIEKQLGFLKWFLRWSMSKGFHHNNTFETYKPKLKKTQKKVVYLSKNELTQLEDYPIPEDKLYLYRVRDVFLFCCFTGLRYSDVYNLRRCDIKDDFIEITTVKTNDSLKIELNKTSKRILEKYKPFTFKEDKALPVISNQKMNQYLHELCKMVGLDEPIRQTYYSGNKRLDIVKPKYEFIGTHTGRRTFICNALSMGISPQIVMKWTGHSDYMAMKPYIDIADEVKSNAMKKFDDL